MLCRACGCPYTCFWCGRLQRAPTDWDEQTVLVCFFLVLAPYDEDGRLQLGDAMTLFPNSGICLNCLFLAWQAWLSPGTRCASSFILLTVDPFCFVKPIVDDEGAPPPHMFLFCPLPTTKPRNKDSDRRAGVPLPKQGGRPAKATQAGRVPEKGTRPREPATCDLHAPMP